MSNTISLRDKKTNLTKSGHGGFKTVAKLGSPLAEDEELETFEAEQSFGDVLISVTGEMQTEERKELTI